MWKITLFGAGLMAFSFSLSASLNKVQEKALNYAKPVHVEVEKSTQILSAIETRNAIYGSSERVDKGTPAQLIAKEKEWRSFAKKMKLWRKSGKKRGHEMPKAEGGVAEVMNSTCSKALVDLNKKYNEIVEIFIMDKMGANVCTNTLTGDFDQGDEDKWIKTYKEQNPEFVDKPELDRSSRKRLTQVSFPVKKGGDFIGAITIGVSQ